MTGAPDLTDPLPVLRHFRWQDRQLHSSVFAEQVFDRGWSVARHAGTKAVGYYDHESPALIGDQPSDSCTQCGFHGWYPWAVARWTYLSPLAPDLRLAPYSTPHPVVRDLLEGWMFDQALAVPGVLDVSGRVVLSDYGVRAQRAQVRAVVLPSSIQSVAPPIEHWSLIVPEYLPWLAMGPYRRVYSPYEIVDKLRYLDELAKWSADYYEANIITIAEALTLSSEWGATGDRIRNKAHQGYV